MPRPTGRLGAATLRKPEGPLSGLPRPGLHMWVLIVRDGFSRSRPRPADGAAPGLCGPLRSDSGTQSLPQDLPTRLLWSGPSVAGWFLTPSTSAGKPVHSFFNSPESARSPGSINCSIGCSGELGADGKGPPVASVPFGSSAVMANLPLRLLSHFQPNPTQMGGRPRPSEGSCGGEALSCGGPTLPASPPLLLPSPAKMQRRPPPKLSGSLAAGSEHRAADFTVMLASPCV